MMGFGDLKTGDQRRSFWLIAESASPSRLTIPDGKMIPPNGRRQELLSYDNLGESNLHLAVSCLENNI